MASSYTTVSRAASARRREWWSLLRSDGRWGWCFHLEVPWRKWLWMVIGIVFFWVWRRCSSGWFGICFSVYWESHHPNWWTHIFQRGRYTTNQSWCFRNVFSWFWKENRLKQSVETGGMLIFCGYAMPQTCVYHFSEIIETWWNMSCFLPEMILFKWVCLRNVGEIFARG